MRGLWWRLFLLFTLVPAVELFLLIQVGRRIGATATVVVILLTGMAGAWLARREGYAVLRQLRGDLDRGLPPAVRVVEGVLVLAGAVLLVTPGLLTDATGFALIIPWTRRAAAPVVLRWLARRFQLEDAIPGELEPKADPDDDSPFSHPVR